MTDPEIGSQVAILPHEHCIGTTGTVKEARRANDLLLGLSTIIVCDICNRGGMIEDNTQNHPLSRSSN